MGYVYQSMENFRQLAKTMDIVLFGSGEYCMRFLNRIGSLTEKVNCILDNNEQNHGRKLYGIPVKDPAELKEREVSDTLVVISTGSNIAELYAQVLAVGDYPIMAARILIDDSFLTFTEEIYRNQHLVRQVSGLLYDDISREIYREVIRRRMLYGECDFSDLIRQADCEYRPSFMYSDSKPEEEVILDCGAFSGDTLRKFVNTFGPALKRIYAFECMRDSLKKLEKTVCYARNTKYSPDIRIMPYALSDKEGKMSFIETLSPGASFVLENRKFAEHNYYRNTEVEVNVSTIDTLIPIEEKVTLIKMDIEGSEYEAILGAKRVIQSCRPRLAIAIYHSGKDYYRLALLVKELVPEYKIAVRHHNKNHCDTDMYCWI